MKPDKEDVEWLQHHRQVRRPLWLFENVFQQEIIAGRSVGDQRAVESIEEAGPIFLPAKVAAPEPFHRYHARVAKMIDRDMPERLVELCLDRTRQRGFSATGRAMNEDDPGAFDHVCSPSQPSAAAGRVMRSL
ncbi:hypothetical protein D9M69_689950 [compost metagenome]